MRVLNIKGISNKWGLDNDSIKYWEKMSKRKTSCCGVYDCQMDAMVGAHVQKVGTDKTMYIVPLCLTHSKSNNELNIGFDLIASKRVTSKSQDASVFDSNSFRNNVIRGKTSGLNSFSAEL